MTRERDDSNSRVRILVIGDAAVPTGFARAIEGIFRGLCDKYEVHHLGVSYDGDPHDYAWKIYRAAIGGDVWGARRIIPLCESVQPHLIFILNDI
ncbi:MAG TPA: hypothetical protein VKB86_14755, partial [Pyrinomonadaceae bacterium]|nr:hypothetical protein [Pyrinomonadaceae bacterium]